MSAGRQLAHTARSSWSAEYSSAARSCFFVGWAGEITAIRALYDHGPGGKPSRTLSAVVV